MHVLFAGMRGAGKSTLCISVAQALHARDPGLSVGLYELDIWSDTHACIRGDKPWEQRNKRGHTYPGEELIQEYLESLAAFATDGSELVLGDMPGRPNRLEHDVLSETVDGVVLVSRDFGPEDLHHRHPQGIEYWERTLDRLELPVIAAVHSVLPGQQAPLERIAISGLDRKPIPDHAEVLKLAELLAADHVAPYSPKETRARNVEALVGEQYKQIGAGSPATS